MNKSENNIHGGPIQVVDEVHILASNDEWEVQMEWVCVYF
jgi:hypothetical protein